MSGDPGPSPLAFAFSQNPDQQQRSERGLTELGSILRERATEQAQLARGVAENVAWQAGTAAKEFGDGFANISSLLYKTGGAIGGMFGGSGWEGAAQSLESTYGTRNPSILDIFSPGSGAGRKADEAIQRRLGSEAAFGEAIGMLGSFVLPGGPVGEAAQSVVKPMAGLSERLAAKVALRGVPGDVAKHLADTGQAWSYLAKNPGMSKNLGIFDDLLRISGRNVNEFVTAGADNIARAYAIAPDDERMHAAKAAALMTPFMLPIARLGESLGRVVVERGLTPDKASALRSAYESFSTGKTGLEELQNAMVSQVGLPRRAVAKLISGTFEGTAFMGLMPGSFDLLKSALSGDPDGMTKLTASWLGNVAGVVAMKMAPGVPPSEIPFFRQSRPDLNRLETYLDAEAAKRAASEAPRTASEVPDVRDQGEVTARQQMAEQASQTQQETAAALNAPVRDPSEIAEESQRQAMLGDHFAAQKREELRKQFGWASDQVQPLLRSSWTPEFIDDSSSVRLNYGRDHSVEVRQDGKLVLNPGVENVLREFGHAPDPDSPNRRVVGPDRIELAGPLAQKALDDLALIGTVQRLRAESQFEKQGYREVEPGVWVDNDGMLHMPQIDGSTVSRNVDGAWTGKDDFKVVGREEPPLWSHPNMEALLRWVTTKHAMVPDGIVDPTILAIIDRAGYGQNRNAEELRHLISGLNPEALMESLGRGTDREVAMLLGSAGTGNGNAESIAAELESAHQYRREAMLRPPQQPEEFARALEGNPPEPTAEQVAAAERSNYLRAMEESTRPLSEVMKAGREPGSRPMEEAGGVSDVGAYFFREIKKALTSPRGKRTLQAAEDVFTKQSEVSARLTEKYDPSLASEMRSAVSGTRPAIEGQAKALLKPAREALKKLNAMARDTVTKKVMGSLFGRHSWSDEMVDVGEGAYRPRWELLVDGRVKPANDLERQFADSVQESLRYLWGEAAKAGATRREFDPTTGQAEIRALKQRDKAVVPFVGGDDLDVVMGTDALRKKWFDWLEKHGDPVQKITSDQLEYEYREAAKPSGGATSSEVLSALDYTRRFRNMPAIWEGYRIRETNPLRIMERQVVRQSARIANTMHFGEDYKPEERMAAIASLKNDPEAAAAVKQLSEKPGLVKRVSDVAGKITDLGSERANEAARQWLMNYAKRVGGEEPIKPSKFLRWLDPYESIGRPLSIWRAFTQDIPEMVTQPLAYATFRDLRKGIGAMVKNRGQAVEMMRQQGAVDNWMAEHVFGEATHFWSKLTDLVSIPGKLTEDGKQTLFGFTAKAMLERWSRGPDGVNDSDRALLSQTMKYTPKQATELLTGTAPEKLKTQFVREFVQLAASRRSPAEGSAFAADPNVNRMFRYVRWATNRMTDTLTHAKELYQAIQKHGASSKEARQAYIRSVRILGLRAIGGAVGQSLAYAMLDAMRGDNGFSRYWREFMESPTKALLWGLVGQTIGGPVMQFARAASSGDPKQALQMVPVANYPYQVASRSVEAVKAFASGDFAKGRKKIESFVLDTLGDVGLAPKAEINALVALLGGRVHDRALSLRASEFERSEGITHPMGSRYRPEEFYNAVEKLYRGARNGEEPNLDALQKALSMAPGESVAASIEGHQRMKHWTNEQRAKFIDTHGDKVFAEMAQEDAALRDLAKRVRKMEGTQPSVFENDLESVRRQANLGAGDRWRTLTDRAVEEASQRLLAGDGMGDEIDTLSEYLADHPEQVATMFNPRVARYLASDGPDSLAKARRISAILKKLARDRAKDARREGATSGR